MSGWLRHLVAQSRTTQRVVRPATAASRAAAVVPNAPPSSLEWEEFIVVRGTPSSIDAAPPAQARTANEPAAPGSQAAARRPDPIERASPSQRDPSRRSSEAVDAAGVRSASRRPRVADDASPRHEDPGRPADERRSPETPARSEATLERAPSLRRETSTSIRPALPARAAAPIREGVAAEPAAPDVHIHIGRLELTAVTAPTPPRGERAASAHKPLSLEEYLRRRNGGGR